MPSESLEPFADNWTYLKAELAWLDRVLLLAIARQRREAQAVERVARTTADRVTSHWWKGIVFLEEGAGFDEGRPPRQEGTVKPGYQQQIQNRIQATRHQGIALGLPTLCDRLKLSNFEKNTILLSLAPEINRRYARLYQYLQNESGSDSRSEATRATTTSHRSSEELPTVDLALRILCRNDSEWRAARQSLTSGSNLIRHSLLKLVASQEETVLARRLQLADGLVSYLLADKPDNKLLDKLLIGGPSRSIGATYLHQERYLCNWEELILPAPVLAELQHLSHRLQWRDLVDHEWGFQSAQAGTIALFKGPAGTGKTMAAKAIAHATHRPLAWLDLALISASDQLQVLQFLAERSPQILLLKSAQVWFGRSAHLPQAALLQWLQRRQQQGLTLLSCTPTHPLAAPWSSHLQTTVNFPVPDLSARLQLWQQAFPPGIPLATGIDWEKLAQRKFSGGAIRAIARDAAFSAAAISQTIEMAHILQALNRALKSGSHRSP